MIKMIDIDIGDQLCGQSTRRAIMKKLLICLALSSCTTIHYGDYVKLSGFYGVCCARIVDYQYFRYKARIMCKDSDKSILFVEAKVSSSMITDVISERECLDLVGKK